MRLITFSQVKKKFCLGDAQAMKVCERARFKKLVSSNVKVGHWKYDPVELAGIVKNLKQTIEREVGL